MQFFFSFFFFMKMPFPCLASTTLFFALYNKINQLYFGNNMNSSSDSNAPIPPGTKVGHVLCARSRSFGDMVVVWDEGGKCAAFAKNTIAEKQPQLYKINHRLVTGVELIPQHDILKITTSTGVHFRTFDNQPLEEAVGWADHFFEPINQQFFRKDNSGQWFDIEGQPLESPVFLQYDVLCSLPGKVSRQSLSFRGQEVVMSPHCSLIQVGKLVLDKQLEAVTFYGKKITGLGVKNITLAHSDSKKKRFVQEVFLSLTQTTFVDEHTLEPFRIDGKPVAAHLETAVVGHHRYEVFQTQASTAALSGQQNTYVLRASTGAVVTCEGDPVTLDFATHVTIAGRELVQYTIPRGRSGYMDLHSGTPFYLEQLPDEAITYIAPTELQGQPTYPAKYGYGPAAICLQ